MFLHGTLQTDCMDRCCIWRCVCHDSCCMFASLPESLQMHIQGVVANAHALEEVEPACM